MDHPVVVYDFNPNNLPEQLLQAVGLVTAASSQTESIVQQFIGAILGIDQAETIALTAHMSNPLKDHAARALIELNAKNAGIVDDVDDLLDAINDAYDKRNVIVHNAFIRNPETSELFSWREKARGSLQGELKPVSIDEIKENAALVYEVGIDLVRFMTSNGISPTERTRPLRTPLDRRKKARTSRRSKSV